MSWHANRPNCPGSNSLDATRTKSVRFLQQGLSVCGNAVVRELCDEKGHSLGHFSHPRILHRLLLRGCAPPHPRPFLPSSHNHAESYHSSRLRTPYPGHQSLNYPMRDLLKTRQRPCCTGALLRVPNTSPTPSGKICVVHSEISSCSPFSPVSLPPAAAPSSSAPSPQRQPTLDTILARAHDVEFTVA